MKVLEIGAFDRIPGSGVGNPMANPPHGTTLAGTRMRSLIVPVSAGGNAWIGKGSGGTMQFTSAHSTSTGNGGWINGAHGALYFEDAAPAQAATNVPLTWGGRIAYVTWTNFRIAAANVLRAVHENGETSVLVSVADYDTPIVAGMSHYWEVAMNRVNNTVRIYKDNSYYTTLDLSASVASRGKIVGISTGTYGLTDRYGNGGATVQLRDVYLIEVEPGDLSDRLGPQVVKPLPISAVNAQWPVNVAGTTLVESLDDFHPSASAPPANNALTTVVVNETDPNGIVQFSNAALDATDRVTAVLYQVDALSATGSSSLDVALLNGNTLESTKALSFSSVYDNTRPPLLTNFAKRAHIRQFAGSSGNKTDVGNLKLKLKATT